MDHPNSEAPAKNPPDEGAPTYFIDGKPALPSGKMIEPAAIEVGTGTISKPSFMNMNVSPIGIRVTSTPPFAATLNVNPLLVILFVTKLNLGDAVNKIVIFEV